MPKLSEVRTGDIININALVLALKGVKNRMKTLAKKEAELKESIKEYYEDELAAKPNDTVVAELSGAGYEAKVKFIARTSVKYTDNATDYLAEKGLSDVLETKVTIRQDLLEQAVLQERITKEELLNIAELKTSRSMLVDVKNI